MERTEIYELIGRIMAGEAKQQDHHHLQQWLNEAEENRRVYERFRLIWHETQWKDQYSNADRVYHKFLEKREKGEEHKVSSSPEKKIRLWKKVSVAAAVLLVGLLSYVWLQNDTAPTVQPAHTDLVVKENPAGEKSKIVLVDGTIVWLNSNSRISYLSSFSDSIRKIELVGEAYFQVAKDKHRPFVVESGGLRTTALGTEFNVQHYAEDSVATIFLSEGSVKIEHMNSPGTFIFLEPGWGVSTTVGSNSLQKFADRDDKWAGWKDGILFFENASMHDVIKTCERWYSVEFSIKGTPPQDWKFTGRFKNEYLENVLESMRYGKSFDYSIQDKHVELIFKN